MDFLRQAFNIVKLSKEEVLNVSQDESATKKGVMILLGVGLLEVLLNFITTKDLTGLFNIVNPLIGIFTLSILVSWGAAILKGEGTSRKELFRAFAYAYVFYIPVLIFNLVFFFLPTNLFLAIILGSISFAIFIWGITIHVVIIKTLYNFSTIRALFALILPIIIITGTILLIALLLGFGIMNIGFFSEYFSGSSSKITPCESIDSECWKTALQNCQPAKVSIRKELGKVSIGSEFEEYGFFVIEDTIKGEDRGNCVLESELKDINVIVPMEDIKKGMHMVCNLPIKSVKNSLTLSYKELDTYCKGSLKDVMPIFQLTLETESSETKKPGVEEDICPANTDFNIKSACVSGNKIEMLLSNDGSEDIREFEIETIGTEGSFREAVTLGKSILAFDMSKEIFEFRPSKIGLITKVRINPLGCPELVKEASLEAC